jgi:hypothetical protein
MSEDLVKQLEQLKVQNEGLICQLDAHKAHLSESINTSLNLRSTLVLFQKKNQELNQVIMVKNDLIAKLENSLKEAQKPATQANAA